MVDASDLLKGFQFAHVLGWLMDLQIVNGLEVMMVRISIFYVIVIN